MKQKIKNELVEGPILKNIVSLSLPLLINNFLDIAYQLIDSFWIGRLGSDAVAAISAGFPLLFLVFSLGTGFSIAGAILTAQYTGKKDREAINNVGFQTLFIMILLSLLFTIIGYLITPSFLKLYKIKGNVLLDSIKYTRILFLGTVFFYIYVSFNSLMRGIGEVKIPMYIALLSVVLNIILDPLFIFGYSIIPPLGVEGAAISTIITQSISAIISVFILLKGLYYIRISPHLKKIDLNLIKKMIFLGIPSSLEMSMTAIGMNIMVAIVSAFGSVALAAYGIGSRINTIAIMLSSAIAMAVTTLVGQNIGAGKIERAKEISKIVIFYGFVIFSLLGMVVFILSTPLARLFIPRDLKTIHDTSLFLKISSFSYGFFAVQMIIRYIFRGMGKTKTSLNIGVFSLWSVRILLAYLLSFIVGLKEIGVWFAFSLSNLTAFLVGVILYIKIKWRREFIRKMLESKR